MAVSALDILSDVEAVRNSASHDAFTFGHSLLPPDLKDTHSKQGRRSSAANASVTDVERLAEEATRASNSVGDKPSDTETTQKLAAAVELAEIYTTLAQATLASNQRNRPASDRFEMAHRRIAELQTRADGELERLRGMQQSVQE